MTTELDDIDFERLIGDRNIDVCKLISEIDKWGIARTLFQYAFHIGKRWPEAEFYIMKNPVWACHYACHVIEGRWIEAEPYIKKNPVFAYRYALDFIRGRWLEAEPYIIKNPKYAHYYAYFVIKDRWPEAEPHINKDSYWASLYSKRLGIEL